MYTPLKWTRSSDWEINLIEAIIDKKVGKNKQQYTKVFKSISKQINDPNTEVKEAVLCEATNHYCEYLLEKICSTTNKSQRQRNLVKCYKYCDRVIQTNYRDSKAWEILGRVYSTMQPDDKLKENTDAYSLNQIVEKQVFCYSKAEKY